MNDLEYLNQISAQVPQKPAGFFSDKKTRTLFGILGGVLLLSIILAVVVMTLPKPSSASDELSRLYLRSDAVNKLITTYNKSVKSSSLRSHGTSLSTVLTDLKTSSSSTLKDSYGITPSSLALSAEDSALVQKSASALETARLNGILDRSYASELAYQISHLLILEDLARSKTSDAYIREYLDSSSASLQALESEFSNFSDSK